MKSESPRDKAKRLLDTATAELRRWEAEAKKWQDFLTLLDLLEDGSSEEALKALGVLPEKSLAPFAVEGMGAAINGKTVQVPQSFKRKLGALAETERVAIEVLTERGAPMHTVDLLKEIKARGVEVGGTEPTSTLSARLSRSELLQNDRRTGWSIKNVG